MKPISRFVLIVFSIVGGLLLSLFVTLVAWNVQIEHRAFQCTDDVGFGFFWHDMQAGWERGLSLGRIDNDGHYNAANCKWMSDIEQNARDAKRQRQPNGNHHQVEQPF